jgi:pSer/pThr/pTyr-binding forkhead associated (FHA) protein
VLELQVPLLAAKALLLLLLFAFIYAVVRRGVGDLRQVPDDEPFEPGREGRGAYAPPPTSDIVLKSDDYASGRHARLTRHGGLLYVEDMGSTNGTFVNGRKTVGATPLRHGDTLRIGSTSFRYEE